MNILQGFIGFVLLNAGSQLYWLFSAVVAFLVGEFTAVRFFKVEPGLNLILISLGAAVIGVLLAFTTRRPAMIVSGFFAGILAAATLPGLFNWSPEVNEWIWLLSAGVIGGLFIYYAYAIAAILLSALIGAQMIALNVHFGGVNPQVMFLAVLVLGLGVQLILARYATPTLEE